MKEQKQNVNELIKQEKKFREIVEDCKKNHLSGLLFHKDLGHIVFIEKESDRATLVELAKIEDEFIRQKRQFTASQMMKSHIDNIDKVNKKAFGIGNKKAPSYLG